ncbi:Ceramide synthase 2 [Pseudolycoriella hygida]|uniref:Ceramide synthase 2 n=1 Tax=Pseudolycoriella hygida TaxID=35572 RepID=A0A9Q0MNX4_9DIPT|nr:Ceramide synthase 2 [Pseudolycoriella hygida]
MEIFRYFSGTFWSTEIWLPPNTTWADMAPGSRPNVNHADAIDLLWVLPLSMLLIVIRYFVETYCLLPIGKCLGVKSSKSKPPNPNQTLEKAYNKNQRLNKKTIIGLAKQVDLTERQIERWWRLRRAQDKPSTLIKFSDSFWKMLYYTYSFSYGVSALWKKPWFWDFNSIWYGYPHHSIDNDIWWYCLITMAYYFGLSLTHLFDYKRKDFWQLFIHHIVTVSSLAISWASNLHREGAVTILAHDSVDILLEFERDNRSSASEASDD